MSETSGYSIAALLTSIFFFPAGYVLAYFGIKDVSTSQKTGRGLNIVALIILGLIPTLSGVGALVYFAAPVTSLYILVAVLAIGILGIARMNKMMKDQEFSSWWCIGFLLYYAIVFPVTVIGLIAYYSIIMF